MHALRIWFCLLACAASPPLAGAGNEESPTAPRTRVACVGDSITWGLEIADRDRHSYPAQLAARLGDRYEVRNFGVNGATALREGSLPYWNTPAFREADSFAPDIVVLMLGTNDSKMRNWDRQHLFEADFCDLIRHFAQRPSRPRVLVCLPPPLTGLLRAANQSVLSGELIPLMRRAAEAEGATLVDVHSAFGESPACIPDGVHPDAYGARIIAETVAAAISPD